MTPAIITFVHPIPRATFDAHFSGCEILASHHDRYGGCWVTKARVKPPVPAFIPKRSYRLEAGQAVLA